MNTGSASHLLHQLVAEMSSAAQREDIARHNSPVITRLIANSERWIRQLMRR